MNLSNKELVLSIALNLKRIARFAEQNNERRIQTFIHDTELYLNELNKIKDLGKFTNTYINFKNKFEKFKSTKLIDKDLIDDAYTYGTILTHRANLL